MSRYIIHGSDGLYETFEVVKGKSLVDVERQLLASIADVDSGEEIDPNHYTIYEIVGKSREVDQEAIEAAQEIRRAAQNAQHKKQQEVQARQQYERLRAEFEGK